MIAHNKFSMGFRYGQLPAQSSKVNFDFQKNVCISLQCGMVHCPSEKYHCHLRMIFALLKSSFFPKFSGSELISSFLRLDIIFQYH